MNALRWLLFLLIATGLNAQESQDELTRGVAKYLLTLQKVADHGAAMTDLTQWMLAIPKREATLEDPRGSVQTSAALVLR